MPRDLTQPYPSIYGIDHPLWPEPECFYYPSTQEAATAIERTYGPHSEHVVVVRHLEAVQTRVQNEGATS